MIQAEVIIVGGGPGGAACAGRLKRAGRQVLVLDQAQFPRFKPCAGWLTPQIFRDLGIRPGDTPPGGCPEEYPHGLVTYRHFQVALGRFKFHLKTLQYAIRRVEFDHWLLQRSGAEVVQHSVKNITREDGRYNIDSQFSAEYLVGAGGTHCPVKKTFFPTEKNPSGQLIVAMEEEFPWQMQDEQCYLWFFEHGLPGYAWYVPKAGGYVNVGIGGVANQLKTRGETLRQHWNRLTEKLDTLGLVRGHAYDPVGHSYLLRGKAQPIQNGQAYLVGDAAGLATLDMGEGIHPAVKSGILAAEAILGGRAYSLASIPRVSWPSLVGLRH